MSESKSVSGMSCRSKGAGTSSFRDTSNRFTDYPDIRDRTSFKAEERSGHLGPGCYDMLDRLVSPIQLSSYQRSRSPVIYRHVDSKHEDKTFISDAPAVGTYNIHREMSFDSGRKHKMSSCFEGSGRSRGLMPNGKVFQTLNEAATLSNVGPGMYDMSQSPSFMGRQIINPTINDRRYRANRARDAIAREMKSQHMASTAPSGLTRSGLLTESIRLNTPSPTQAQIPQSGVCSISPAERNHDIQSVRNLPDYPNR